MAKQKQKQEPQEPDNLEPQQPQEQQPEGLEAKVQAAEPETATGFQTTEQKAIQAPETTDAQKLQAVQTEQKTSQEQPDVFGYARGYQADKAEPLEGVQHNLNGIQTLLAHQQYAEQVEAEKGRQARGEGDKTRLLTSTQE